MPLLRLKGKRGNRAGFQSAQADRLAGLLAVAVGAVFDALQRRVDFGQQLAVTLARTDFDGPVEFLLGAIELLRKRPALLASGFICRSLRGLSLLLLTVQLVPPGDGVVFAQLEFFRHPLCLFLVVV
jgi:hypothetical protein